MQSAKLTYAILGFTLLTAIYLRFDGSAAKSTFAEDEGFSFLYATGHASEYYETLAGKPPFGAWVQASAWNKFLLPEKLFCFSKITRDMALFDIHPPFYFWFLHVWAFIVGINLWTGPTLNILFNIIAIFSLYGLARYVLGNRVEAALVSCFWALSPAVFQMSFEARQYDLLALIAIFFVWQLLRYADRERKPSAVDFALLALATAAGALTHFHFNILAGGCGLYAIFKLIRNDKTRLLSGIGAVVLGYLLFLWITPSFFKSFGNARETLEVFSQEALRHRATVVRDTCRQFFVNPISLRYELPILLIAAVAVAFRQKPATFIQQLRAIDLRGAYIFYFALWTAGAQLALYFSFLTPVQSLQPKHLGMAWPFLAFLPICILRLLPKYKNHLAILCCVLAFASGLKGLQIFKTFLASKPNPAAILENTNAVVIDNVSVSYLPRVLWKLPADKWVFAADRSYLVNHPEQWLSRLENGAVYISIHSKAHFSGNVAGGQQQLYGLIAQQRDNEFIKGGAWGFGDVMRIRKKL